MAKLVCCLLIYLFLASTDYHVVSGFTPVIYSPESSTECGQGDPLQDDQLMEALSKIQVHSRMHRSSPRFSAPSAPSGYHEIRVPNGSLVQVYCDMKGANLEEKEAG